MEAAVAPSISPRGDDLAHTQPDDLGRARFEAVGTRTDESGVGVDERPVESCVAVSAQESGGGVESRTGGRPGGRGGAAGEVEVGGETVVWFGRAV